MQSWVRSLCTLYVDIFAIFLKIFVTYERVNWMKVTLHRHRQYFHLHRKSKKDISSYYRFIRAWTHQCKRIELPNHKKFTFAPMPPLVEKIGQLDLNQFEHEVNLIMNATCKTTKIEGNFAYGKLPHCSPTRAHSVTPCFLFGVESDGYGQVTNN